MMIIHCNAPLLFRQRHKQLNGAIKPAGATLTLFYVVPLISCKVTV